MEADGIIDRYAIGGAVGATFYLEPVATLDVDIFISFQAQLGSLLISPEPVFKYLTERGALPGIFNAPASRLKKSCRGVKSNFLSLNAPQHTSASVQTLRLLLLSLLAFTAHAHAAVAAHLARRQRGRGQITRVHSSIF